jgi:branched-chain amino acid aminotransferase
MPTYIRFLAPDGTLTPADYSASSLAEAGLYEPQDGVYTITNTFEATKALKIDAHLDRLEDSAHKADIALTLDRAHLRAGLRRCILDSGFGDVRFRVTVGKSQPERFTITLEPFTPISQDIIRHGVRVETIANSARENAGAKTTGWMTRREALIRNMNPGIYDLILMDADGHLLEGLGANFYAILNGSLHTATENVLPGISRLIVYEVAPAIVPLRLEAVHQDDIPRLSEAFITSASRGIVPVVEIDGHLLGDGKPGAMTLALRAAYQAWVIENLEEI